jgi:hypothetical protein
MSAIVLAAADQYEAIVTVTVALAGFTVVGLMWMAVTFGRTGIGITHHLPTDLDSDDASGDFDGEPMGDQ